MWVVVCVLVGGYWWVGFVGGLRLDGVVSFLGGLLCDGCDFGRVAVLGRIAIFGRVAIEGCAWMRWLRFWGEGCGWDGGEF